MSDVFIKSDLVVLPSKMPFWEISKVFDEYFNNTTDTLPEAARKLDALMRDNVQYTSIYLGILESRIRVAKSSLFNSLKGDDVNKKDDEGTEHCFA